MEGTYSQIHGVSRRSGLPSFLSRVLFGWVLQTLLSLVARHLIQHLFEDALAHIFLEFGSASSSRSDTSLKRGLFFYLFRHECRSGYYIRVEEFGGLFFDKSFPLSFCGRWFFAKFHHHKSPGRRPYLIFRLHRFKQIRREGTPPKLCSTVH